MKALGYGNRAVGWYYVMLVLMIVAVGAVVGVALGIRLGFGMTRLYVKYFHFPSLEFTVPAPVLVVIDEAHCISDWGFDFRPDYQRLARALLATPHASVLATTATANQRVTEDVERQLGASTVTFRGTLARTSLRLSVVPGLSAIQRYAWVADALATIEGSGIIYVLTVAEAERLSGFLQHCGYSAPAYTGPAAAPGPRSRGPRTSGGSGG